MSAGGSVGGTVRENSSWGDRQQRRRDVLSAAAAVLEEAGWDGFSIRETASRAGVSGGAVYQWFSGKGEIWAELQTARFVGYTAEIEGWPTQLSPRETVHRLVQIIATNHAEIGRHRFEFVRGLKGRIPEYAVELTSAHRVLSDAIADRVESLHGADPPLDMAARVSWLWAVGKGVGDHLVDSRFEISGVDRLDFLETTTECVLAGLLAPSPVTVSGAPDEDRP